MSNFRTANDYLRAAQTASTIGELKALALDYNNHIGSLENQLEFINSEIDRPTKEKQEIENKCNWFGPDIKSYISRKIGELIIGEAMIDGS